MALCGWPQAVERGARRALARWRTSRSLLSFCTTSPRWGASARAFSSMRARRRSRLVEALREAGGEPDLGADPITLMKARKNAAEIRGSRAAHLRDGAAVSSFLAWFAEEAPKGRMTEIDAVMALETFRRQTKKLKEVSFPTISGAGPNGAIVHYRVTEAHQPQDRQGPLPARFGRAIRGRHHRHHAHHRGGQARARRCATASRACSRATSPSRAPCFRRAPAARSSTRSRAAPCGTPGSTTTTAPATASARSSPCTKDRRTSPSAPSCALEPGMILSNEPGYYKTGAYGIRIENLVLVEKRDVKGAERETLRLRNADARADRPRLRRAEASHARRTALARRLSCAGPPRAVAACVAGYAQMARVCDQAAQPGLSRVRNHTHPAPLSPESKGPNRRHAMSRARTKLLCTTLLVSGLAVGMAPFAPSLFAPAAHAQQRVEVRQEFRVALEPHGRFERHERFGEVWRPNRISRDWRPYTVGRWVYTDDWGWYWNSDQTEADWGWVAFHYGRWVDDRQMGWVWVPGEEWGPAWVNWRRGEGQAVAARRTRFRSRRRFRRRALHRLVAPSSGRRDRRISRQSGRVDLRARSRHRLAAHQHGDHSRAPSGNPAADRRRQPHRRGARARRDREPRHLAELRRRVRRASHRDLRCASARHRGHDARQQRHRGARR